MPVRLQRVVSIAAVALLVLVGTVVLAGAVAFSAGAVHVRVHEKKAGGDNINLILPAAAVPLGLRLMPAEKRAEVAAQFGPWAPVIREAALELARAPDATLVEVISPREHVRIEKRGGSLILDVDSEDETVHASVPLSLIADVVTQLEPGTPPTEESRLAAPTL